MTSETTATLRNFLFRLEQSAGDATAQKLLDDNPDLEQLLKSADEGQADQPADRNGSTGELGTAADFLRSATFQGAMTATPAVAALLRARESLADWLGCLATLAPDDHSGDTCNWCGANHALDIARAVNGSGR